MIFIIIIIIDLFFCLSSLSSLAVVLVPTPFVNASPPCTTADCFMADLEDSTSPTWANVVRGQINLRDAVNGTITFPNKVWSIISPYCCCCYWWWWWWWWWYCCFPLSSSSSSSPSSSFFFSLTCSFDNIQRHATLKIPGAGNFFSFVARNNE